MRTHPNFSRTAARCNSQDAGIQEQINLIAYHLFIEKGLIEGHDLDHYRARAAKLIKLHADAAPQIKLSPSRRLDEFQRGSMLCPQIFSQDMPATFRSDEQSLR